MNADDADATMAVFLDLENIALGARDAHYPRFDIQKLLERLESKGCVRRDRRAAVHVFAPLLGRDELVGRRVRAVAEQLCGGSLTSLLTHLVQTTRLSARERQELRSLLEELEKQRSRR